MQDAMLCLTRAVLLATCAWGFACGGGAAGRSELASKSVMSFETSYSGKRGELDATLRLLPAGDSFCPEVSDEATASVDGLPLANTNVGGPYYGRQDGGSGGGCMPARFDLLGVEPYDASPWSVVEMTDRNEKWTLLASDVMAAKDVVVSAPAAASVASGQNVTLTVSPQGATLASVAVDFVLDSHLDASGHYTAADCTWSSAVTGQMTISGNQVSFAMCTQTGAGHLFVSGALVSEAASCERVSRCQVQQSFTADLAVNAS